MPNDPGLKDSISALFGSVGNSGNVPSSNPQICGRFQRCATDAANHGGTIAADERLSHFASAIRTVERFRRSLRGLGWARQTILFLWHKVPVATKGARTRLRFE